MDIIIFDTHRWKPPSMNSAADNVVSYRIKVFIKTKKTTTTFYLMVLYSSNEVKKLIDILSCALSNFVISKYCKKSMEV